MVTPAIVGIHPHAGPDVTPIDWDDEPVDPGIQKGLSIGRAFKDINGMFPAP